MCRLWQIVAGRVLQGLSERKFNNDKISHVLKPALSQKERSGNSRRRDQSKI